ncbi:MAG: hypothetical protein IPP51_12825 [Bacteroidetes bacterium]|nr:hypothetical protein [Bacteroidota bacterium]
MRIIKLSELIHALKPFETGAFRDYLNSPFFNRNDRLPILYDLLSKDKSLSLENEKSLIYKQLFPGKRFNDKELRYHFSDLNRHLEHFFTLAEIEKDDREFLLLTQRALLKRKTYKAYAHSRLRFNSLEKTENAGLYLSSLLSAELHHSFNSASLSRLSDSDYESLLGNLDRFYIAKKLQLQCEIVNLKNILRKEYESLLINEIIELVIRKEFFGSAYIEIYYHILLMLTLHDQESEKHFSAVNELTEKHKDSFQIPDLNSIYQYIKNYCIRKINKGEDEYRLRLFGIYKSILSNRRIMNHDYLSTFEFKNIVTLGLRLNEDKWVKEFIPKYINSIPPTDRKNALTYNSAMLNFFLKNYRQVIKGLQEVEFTDLYYQMDSRSVLLKVYFETDDDETLLHHIAAFKIFIRRNKLLSDFQRTIYQNFIRYTLKIYRAGTRKAKLEQLRSEIIATPNISDKNWLLSKIDDQLIS